jgi:hypothetical protein
MKAHELDAAFDAGVDINAAVDWTTASRPNLAIKRVNVDFPKWVVDSLDRLAQHLGVTRQSLIKIWIAERVAL